MIPKEWWNAFHNHYSDDKIYIQEISKPDLDSEVNNKSTKLNNCKEWYSNSRYNEVYGVTITPATVANAGHC